MIKHGCTEGTHRLSLPTHRLRSSICQTLFWLFLIPCYSLLLNKSRGLPFTMVKLCWAQESNEGMANQYGTQNEGAYKITILGSKTTGCVCEECLKGYICWTEQCGRRRGWLEERKGDKWEQSKRVRYLKGEVFFFLFWQIRLQSFFPTEGCVAQKLPKY